MDHQESAQAPIAQTGTFRAYPLSWTIEESDKSESVCIVIRFGVRAEWDEENEAWSADWPEGWYCDHRAWIVKADGSENPKAVASLSEAGLWHGDFDVLTGPPPAVYALIDVQQEEYQGRQQFRAAWVNPNADRPRKRGAFKPANPALIDTMRAKFGGKMRAIAGGQPAGSAPAPPKPPTAEPAPQAPAAPSPAAPAPAAPVPAAPAAPAPPSPPSLPQAAQASGDSVFPPTEKPPF